MAKEREIASRIQIGESMNKTEHLNKNDLLAAYSKGKGPFISCYIHDDTDKPNKFFQDLLGISENDVLTIRMEEILIIFRDDAHNFVNTYHEDEIDCYMCSFENGESITENT